MQSRYNSLLEKKKKKWPYIVSGTIAGLLIGVMVVWVGMNDWNIDKSIGEFQNLTEVKQTAEVDKTEEPIIEEPPIEKPVQEVPIKVEPDVKEVDMSGAKGYVGNEILPQEPTVVEGVIIASKKYPLPATYAPGESKEARAAFQELAAEASLSGYDLVAFSTYRSYDYQTQLYDRYVTNDGQEAADRYSARPGYSEHQTGLAFDIGEKLFEQHFARESFGETAAGRWVAANAYKYGFIMRYPKGSEKITGYMYEPWHFRYIGVELAGKVYQSNETLEEFFDL